MEKMYYISYGKKIDRAVYCKKILDIVPVSFFILKIPKYYINPTLQSVATEL